MQSIFSLGMFQYTYLLASYFMKHHHSSFVKNNSGYLTEKVAT